MLEELVKELNEKSEAFNTRVKYGNAEYIRVLDMVIEKVSECLYSVLLVGVFGEIMVGYFSEDELPTLIQARQRYYNKLNGKE